MALKKPEGECPVCEQHVQFDSQMSGGVITYRCCNCFHYVTKDEVTKIEEAYHASLAENG